MVKVRRFKIGNLVRDKMPEQIQRLGGVANFHYLDGEAHLDWLKLKLNEETREVCKASTPKEIQEEIGDVLEVLKALATKSGLKWEHIEKKCLQKKNERGGFKKGTFINSIEVRTDNDAHPIVNYCLNNPGAYPEIIEE